MTRIAVALVLFISLFVMMQNISGTWRRDRRLKTTETEKKIDVKQDLPGGAAVQPQVPPVLPDLKPRYLFNPERKLEEEGAGPKDEDLAAGNDLGIKANVKDIIYSGSVIGENFSRALISFSVPKGRTSKRRTSRSAKKRVSGRSAEEHAQLKEGDILSGYKVAEIKPDRIIFKKGDEVIEKFLYDPKKKRVAPTRQAKSVAKLPARPAPPPGSATRGRATRTLPQKAAVRPKTVRRMVVSRKPPPKPDTSRVSRRRRTSSTPFATPPMPTFNK